MRRDYIETMKADGLGEFLDACEALKNCKFVIAEHKIAALLKAIADNKQLYSMFGTALYGFDYKVTFTESIGNGVFSLPSEPKKAIALVFRILLDIDSGKMSLQNFLEAYFYNTSINESYARFCLEIVAPFEKYCRSMFAQSDKITLAAERDGDPALAYENVNGKFRVNLKADALNCVAALKDIANSAITGAIDRAEFNACLNGLSHAVKSDDYDNIISAFLGVKYAVAYFFKSTKEALEIYRKLEYDIKHLAD
ncbi:MAG: hypothetical protein J1G01_02180 [Clostridiales bacterium]|nr:hypothetical protein [Clostridiales bacterium]